MIEVINKIIKYSRRNKTYPGATLDQIKHIEIKCGYSLPSGYSELYSTTNGGRLFNNELLEIDDVIELLNDNTYIEKEDMIVFPTDYVKKVITYKNRIPLFKKKNDVIFIDLDPDTNGVTGQIVLYANNTMRVLANSLKDFIIELSNNLDDIYKRDLFSYFITSNITFIKNDKDADVIKLNNNKIGVKVLNLDNNVLSKEFINKKLDTNLFINILNSFIRITNTFNERVKNNIIIFDRSMNHTIYNYFYYTELYNKNNFTVTDINEYINKLKEINIDILANMDFKLGLIYQIDDKVNRSYVNANHRLDVLVSKSKITIKYVFNVKESYIYDEVNNLISYISNIEEAKVISNIDETFLKLDKNIILEAYNLFKTDMPKYNFDFVDESKINYNVHINELINNMLSCNWIDMSYGMDIERIESKNISDLTLDELKKYFSAIIKREEIEKGYIAILIDRGIFDKLIFKLKEYKENV